MPDGGAGENWAKNPSSPTEPPGWSWQESQQGLEGGAGPGGLLGVGQLRWLGHLGPSCTEAPGTPLSGLCLSPGRAGVSWFNVPGAVIQHLSSGRYFYWVLFIQSSAFEICLHASPSERRELIWIQCVVLSQPEKSFP